MSDTLITIPKPLHAVPSDSGLDSYRIQTLSLGVTQSPDAVIELTMVIGDRKASLRLDMASRDHLIRLLSGEVRP